MHDCVDDGRNSLRCKIIELPSIRIDGLLSVNAIWFVKSTKNLRENVKISGQEMYKGFDSRNQRPNLLVGVKEKTNLLEHRFAPLI